MPQDTFFDTEDSSEVTGLEIWHLFVVLVKFQQYTIYLPITLPRTFFTAPTGTALVRTNSNLLTPCRAAAEEW